MLGTRDRKMKKHGSSPLDYWEDTSFSHLVSHCYDHKSKGSGYTVLTWYYSAHTEGSPIFIELAMVNPVKKALLNILSLTIIKFKLIHFMVRKLFLLQHTGKIYFIKVISIA